MYNRFLNGTSSKPLKYVVICIVISLIVFVSVGSFYQVNRSVLGEGEIVATLGEKEISSRVDGSLLELKVSIGEELKSNQIVAQLKIPSTDHQSVLNLLGQIKKFYDLHIKDPALTSSWPEIQSENPTIMTSLTSSSQSWNRYQILVRESKVSAKRRLENLISRKLKTAAKLKILMKSNQSSLMGALKDEFIEQIEKIEEEMISVEEEIQAKKTIARSESLSQIKHTYLAIYDFLEQHIVRSPADGILAKANVASFQQVQKGQSLFSIIPSPAYFAVKLRIPTSRISQIEPESNVQIAVDAYPYQKFGYFTGKVFTIDQMTTTNESFFEIKVSLQPPEVSELRKPASALRLLTGMKVKGYVITKRQSLVRMIYERVFLDESW